MGGSFCKADTVSDLRFTLQIPFFLGCHVVSFNYHLANESSGETLR